MNINIKEIFDNKLKELTESKLIESTLSTAIEKTVLSAINEALDSYSLKRDIEKQIENQVSSCIADIGFTAYNTFIAEKIKEITEGHLRADVVAKIENTFNSIYLQKRDRIKLSEIFDAYRQMICDSLDESEKYDLRHFYVKFEKHDTYGWYDVELGEKEPESRYSSSDDIIKFTLHVRGIGATREGWIGSTYIDGKKVKGKFKIGNLNDFESLLINIIYNETPIDIDIEDEDDIDTSFDIDD